MFSSVAANVLLIIQVVLYSEADLISLSHRVNYVILTSKVAKLCNALAMWHLRWVQVDAEAWSRVFSMNESDVRCDRCICHPLA